MAVLALLLVTGCRKVTVESYDKSRKLTYTCGVVFSQVETADDRRILLHNSEKLQRHARRHNRLHDVRELQAAAEANDYERLEELIVAYKCAHDVE